MEGDIQSPVSGPGPVGQIGAIAAGTYTDIIDIIAPAEAAYGEEVSVEVRVKNLHTSPIYIGTTARYNGVDIFPTEDYASVDPGATHSFYFNFIMPNNDVELHVWSFYWTVEEWYQDDSGIAYIALAAPTVLFPVQYLKEGGRLWREQEYK